jgi:predicted dehydrogenase
MKSALVPIRWSAHYLDVMDICTPPQSHVSLAITAMEASCHALVEKPLAMSVEDVEEMLEGFKKGECQTLHNPSELTQPGSATG